MCGRYVTPEMADAERNLMVHWLEYERSYNVAPTDRVPVVRWFEGARLGLHMRWGSVPYFARGIPPKYGTINATIEKASRVCDSSRGDDGTKTLSCTIITMPPNALMAEIHNAKQRMPAILAADQIGAWLRGSLDRRQSGA